MRSGILAALIGLAAASTAHAALDFSSYHSPGDVASILQGFQVDHPALAMVATIGMSGEGRPIQAIKISDNPGLDETDDGDVIFLAAMHAREWLTVEMSLYLAEYLLENYATDPQLRADVDHLEIWIVPIANPDGVAYTWDPAGDRYWRKNRRDNGDGTFGVDLNRNWGYQWGLDSGSSPNGSDEVYRGPSAFSEPEDRALRDLIAAQKPRAVISYHTYSQLFLRPWSHTADDPPGEPTLRSISDRSIALMAAIHGITYDDAIWYTSSGEATDWLWGESRTAGFTPEMRPDCCGLAGFSPPASTILPNAEENLPAALAIIHDAAASHIWIADYPGDSGAEPSAEWTGAGWSHAFWVSPDIWTVPEQLNQGATVTLNVRIHNATGATQVGAQVDAYYSDPRISLEFPNLAATLIGSRTVTLPPGDHVVSMPWTVPTGTNSWGERHWCVGAVVRHTTDMPLTTQAQRTSNIGIRNFETTEIVESGKLLVSATNYLKVPSELLVHIDQARIPRGWNVTMPPRPQPLRDLSRTASQRKALLLGTTGILVEPGETILLPLQVEVLPEVRPGTAAELRVHAAFLPLVPGRREPLGNGYTFRVVAGRRCDSPPARPPR